MKVQKFMSKDRIDEINLKKKISWQQMTKKSNLYITGLPTVWKEEQLRDFFKGYGNIVSVKIGEYCPTYSYAFVCFENADQAAAARHSLNNVCIEDKNIEIHPYEIKELLQLQKEDEQDQKDWEKYIS